MGDQTRLERFIRAYYPKPVSDLERYTNMPAEERGRDLAEDDPENFAHWLHNYDSGLYWDCLDDDTREEYIEFKTEGKGDSVDLDNYDIPRRTWENLNLDLIPDSDEVFAEYAQEMEESIAHNSPSSHTKSYLDFVPERRVKNEWMVHFTRQAERVAWEGFTKGTRNYQYLSLTEGTPKYNEGYNFAYLAERDNLESVGTKYGDECVLFMGSGILYTQVSDNHDEQVIFWGQTARNRIPIFRNKIDNIWYVGNHNKPLRTNPDLYVLVHWCIRNFQQYRKQLVPTWRQTTSPKQPTMVARKAAFATLCQTIIGDLPTGKVAFKEDLDEAINSEVAYLRAWAAKQEGLTREMQHVLANDEEKRVRVALATNEDILENTMFMLAADSEPVVLALAKNPTCTTEVLALIHNRFKKHLNHGGSPITWAVAEHPHTPPEVLSSMIHPDPALKRMNRYTGFFAAGNPNTPVETLWAIFEGADEATLENLLTNPGLPSDLYDEVRHGLSKLHLDDEA